MPAAGSRPDRLAVLRFFLTRWPVGCLRQVLHCEPSGLSTCPRSSLRTFLRDACVASRSWWNSCPDGSDTRKLRRFRRCSTFERGRWNCYAGAQKCRRCSSCGYGRPCDHEMFFSRTVEVPQIQFIAGAGGHVRSQQRRARFQRMVAVKGVLSVFPHFSRSFGLSRS